MFHALNIIWLLSCAAATQSTVTRVRGSSACNAQGSAECDQRLSSHWNAFYGTQFSPSSFSWHNLRHFIGAKCFHVRAVGAQQKTPAVLRRVSEVRCLIATRRTAVPRLVQDGLEWCIELRKGKPTRIGNSLDSVLFRYALQQFWCEILIHRAIVILYEIV